MRTISALMGAALLCAGASQAPASDAADYPSRVIEIIVPLAPGGPNDIIARMVAAEFERLLKARVVVLNRPGAGSVIGTLQVAAAKPDGYTLMITSNSFAVNPSINPNATYDPLKDFIPISLLAEGPHVMVVRPDLPAGTMAELVAHSKTKPGGLQFASPGVGTLPHLNYLLFEQRTGGVFTHVPYKGAGPALAAIAGGHVDVMWVGFAPALPHIAAGKLKPLAVSSLKPAESLPGVPTVAASIPGYEVTNRIWLAAPANTPQAVIDKIADAAAKLATSAQYGKALVKAGYEPGGTGPADTAKQVAEETATWAEVVKKAGLEKKAAPAK